MRVFVFATLIGAVLLQGCASVGVEFDLAAVNKLEPGIATLSDAVALLGPYTSSSLANGIATYGWTFAASNILTGATESRAALLTFGPDGKLIQRSTSSMPVKTP